jgi:hypothetical protein
MRETIDWAARAIGRGAKVIAVHPLHENQGPWRLEVEHAGRLTEFVLRMPTPRIDAAMIRTGAAALELAARCGLPAPRLIAADLDTPVSLEAVVGPSDWPPPPTVERLRAAGAALVDVHRFAMEPRADLPFRPRPIAGCRGQKRTAGEMNSLAVSQFIAQGWACRKARGVLHNHRSKPKNLRKRERREV